MFKLELKTENEAFQDDNRATELVRILKSVTEEVAQGQESGWVRDINGNRVGKWIISE